MNKFFIDITKNLKLKEDQGSPPVTLNGILEKFIFHPSIDKNRKTYESDKKFSFQQETEEHVRQVILSIDGIKPHLWETKKKQHDESNKQRQHVFYWELSGINNIEKIFWNMQF